ncbi:hypothetical protein K525DRAFT_192512 [Schizophyllum commune Loenen D]|nr:hypothetical protein K525DRAFT_192512 [Schizophyllum commune Loenen D]
MDTSTHIQDTENTNNNIEDDEGEDEPPQWEELPMRDALSRWIAQYDSTDAQEVRAARNFVKAFTTYFEYLHLEKKHTHLCYSYAITDFVESVNGD